MRHGNWNTDTILRKNINNAKIIQKMTFLEFLWYLAFFTALTEQWKKNFTALV